MEKKLVTCIVLLLYCFKGGAITKDDIIQCAKAADIKRNNFQLIQNLVSEYPQMLLDENVKEVFDWIAQNVLPGKIRPFADCLTKRHPDKLLAIRQLIREMSPYKVETAEMGTQTDDGAAGISTDDSGDKGGAAK